jgi:hypothetical protein
MVDGTSRVDRRETLQAVANSYCWQKCQTSFEPKRTALDRPDLEGLTNL